MIHHSAYIARTQRETDFFFTPGPQTVNGACHNLCLISSGRSEWKPLTDTLSVFL